MTAPRKQTLFLDCAARVVLGDYLWEIRKFRREQDTLGKGKMLPKHWVPSDEGINLIYESLITRTLRRNKRLFPQITLKDVKSWWKRPAYALEQVRKRLISFSETLIPSVVVPASHWAIPEGGGFSNAEKAEKGIRVTDTLPSRCRSRNNAAGLYLPTRNRCMLYRELWHWLYKSGNAANSTARQACRANNWLPEEVLDRDPPPDRLRRPTE